MGKITIRDLYEYVKTLQSPAPLLGALNFDTDWAAAYNAASARLDRNFGKTLGCFEPLENLPDLDDIAEVYDEWVGDVDAVLFKMQANLDQLWKATIVDYNPIENYDKYAEIEDQESGSDSITKVIGIQNNQDNWGAMNVSDIMAEKTDQEINPLKRSSEILKANAANAGETWKDKKEYAEEAYTASVVEGAHTDRHETAARADTHIIGGRNDNDTTSYGKKVVHTEHIHGDIGVLTPDAMLGGHWNAWTNVVKFFDAMMYMIVSELCTLSEEVRV